MNKRWQTEEYQALIPMRRIGPVKIISEDWQAEVLLPLATLESPLWPSTHRGARVCTQAGGIRAAVIKDQMTRSILVEADSFIHLQEVLNDLPQRREEIEKLVKQSSRFARLVEWHSQIVGSLLYLRFAFETGDASGHNMVTQAADQVLTWMLQHYPALRYVSVSGNYCSDKKVSAVNGILGRGKYVVAEVTIPAALCRRYLKTTPEKIVDLNIKKNLLGNIVAGGLRTANAHFANMLLGFYLATGQDVANIVEGSQGLVHAELRGQDLYFSVTLPNVIIGTVGNGKELPFVRENLQCMDCLSENKPGENAKRLAMIAASAVLCGELSLLAAQTKPGELMSSHIKLERKKRESA